MTGLRAIVAYEESGKVTTRLRAMGIEAYSCDLRPTRGNPDWHIQGKVSDLLARDMDWDFAVAFPPCTDLAVSGARHFAAKVADGRQQAALDEIAMIMALPFPWALENPVSIISSRFRKPDQTFHPYMFGHGEVKRTCLWLSGLPRLKPTNVVDGRHPRVHLMAPGPNRARDRSETFDGVADAMSSQWGEYMISQSERRAA